MWCFSPGRRTGARGAGRRDVRPDYLAGLLLAGHRALGALAGTGVGLRALTADRQPTAVAQALVGPDLDLAADVGLDRAAQASLDLEVALDVVTQGDEVAVRHVLDAQVRAHARGLERLLGAGAPDAVDVGERHLEPLLAGEVDADESCQLVLLMLLGGPPRHPPVRAGRAPASEPGVALSAGGTSGGRSPPSSGQP